MKVVLEKLVPDIGSSFKILLTPNLNDLFYWHFHPEFEIVYVEAQNGVRHVGDHISRYEGSDLVFIGPNIPHLNFDYGVKTDCEQVVVQMKEDFLGKDFFYVPENNGETGKPPLWIKGSFPKDLKGTPAAIQLMVETEEGKGGSFLFPIAPQLALFREKK